MCRLMRKLSSDECIIGKVPALTDDKVHLTFYKDYRSMYCLMNGILIKTVRYLG